ncbi:MAG: hypothetical protein IJW21_08230, partial [Clostridia bacterium]|nr:hypothetical protein [Clostridia bacterium]
EIFRYEYTEDGLLYKEKFYNNWNGINRHDYTLEYDKDGNVVKKEAWDYTSDGKVLYSYVYLYDSEGRQIYYSQTDRFGNVWESNTTYDD